MNKNIYLKFHILIAIFTLFYQLSLSYAQESPIMTIPAEDGDKIMSVAVSPDESKLFIGTKIPVIWDLNKQTKITTLPFRSDFPPLGASAFSPDGKKILLGHGRANVTYWDLEVNKEIYTIEAAYGNQYLNPYDTVLLGPVTAITFSCDGKTFFTGSFSGVIQRWEALTGKEIAHYPVNGCIWYLQLINDEKELFVQMSGRFGILNIETGIMRFEKNYWGSLTPDGPLVMSYYQIGASRLKYYVWNAITEKLIREGLIKSDAYPSPCEIFPGNKYLLIGADIDSGNKLQRRSIINFSTFDTLFSYPFDMNSDKDTPTSEDDKILIFPNGEKFLTVNGKNVHIWDVSDLTAGARNAESLNP